MIEATNKKTKTASPGLASIGCSNLALPPSTKRTAARGDFKRYCPGGRLEHGAAQARGDSRNPGIITQSKTGSRKWTKNRKTDAKHAHKAKRLGKDNRPSVRSQRKLAAILGIGETTVGRISKHAWIRTFKHVKATRDAETKRVRRWRLAGEILELFAGGVRTERIS